MLPQGPPGVGPRGRRLPLPRALKAAVGRAKAPARRAGRGENGAKGAMGPRVRGGGKRPRAQLQSAASGDQVGGTSLAQRQPT
jgi:hypothetical protein